MNDATVISLLLTVVAIGAALAVYGVLRERGRGAVAAGCLGILTGLGLITLVVAISIARILL